MVMAQKLYSMFTKWNPVTWPLYKKKRELLYSHSYETPINIEKGMSDDREQSAVSPKTLKSERFEL